ncbi:hypothetical protein ACE6H2_026188 [Prunus campanulata]
MNSLLSSSFIVSSLSSSFTHLHPHFSFVPLQNLKFVTSLEQPRTQISEAQMRKLPS